MGARTIIVGAGPAGLATAACLKRAGLEFEIIEAAAHVGASWRKHYDRLHLHTDKGSSHLPFLPFPKNFPRYPSRQQVVDYLEAYARELDLQPRLGEAVSVVKPAQGAWQVTTEQRVVSCENVVIATGYSRRPLRVQWPGQEQYQGQVLHSSDYKNGKAFEGRRVLVVGLGNSGGEIAIDLWEHKARPSLSVRGPVHVVPRDLFGIPLVRLTGTFSLLPPAWADAISAPFLRLALGNVSKSGLRRPSRGPLAQIARTQRIPLIDVGTVDLLRRKEIGLFPGIERFTPEGVRFTDGREEAFDAVVLATGYRAAVEEFLREVPEVLNETGAPVASGQEVRPGLFFCGYFVSPRGMLRQIGDEARQISAVIASRALRAGENRADSSTQTRPPPSRSQGLRH